MPSVYAPSLNNWELITTFWVKSWNTINEQETTFETFWDSEASLVGISMSCDGDRRLFGDSDENNGSRKHAERIPSEDWIVGFILHIPMSDLRSLNDFISVKGITVGLS
jgi:hypothetical protein